MDKSPHPGSARSTGNSKRKQSISIPAPAEPLLPASWQWLAIGCLAAATIILGFIGFWKNAARWNAARSLVPKTWRGK
jgi:hypothetical protein